MIHVNRFGKFALAAIAIMLFHFASGSARAQAVASAQIAGVVTDQSGGAVPNASVRMVETSRNVPHATMSDAQGRYVLPNLPVGSYRLEVSASGFKNHIQAGLELQVGNNVAVNVTLQVGAVSENIEVTARAQMVQTEDNSVSQVIDEKRITELPLNGRQATQLVLISGAAVTAPAGDMSGSKNFYSSTTISVAGGQANSTNYLLDGGDNNDTMTNVNLPFPFPDALQEFSVETSSLPARNGLHPGAAVNIVTKSGSNQWHGSVFDYLRNGSLNARNFFAPTHDLLKRNQFGGTFGGRIIKDKLFFFGGYQGTRQKTVLSTTTVTVPTAAAAAGDFSVLDGAGCQTSKTARAIKDPATPTGVIFANSFIAPSRFDPAAVKLLSYLPTTTDPCGIFRYTIPATGDEDQFIGRVDWVQNTKHTVYGRYFVVDYRNPAVWDPKNVLVTTNPGNLERAQLLTVGDTYTISPTTINAFHATFTRRRDDRGPNGQDINLQTLGVKLSIAVPNDLRIAVGSGSAGFNVGCGTCSPGHFNVNTFAFTDDVDLIRGKHQLAFGVNLVRTQNNTLSGYLQNGNAAFSGQASNDPIADFLLGSMSAFSQSRAQQVGLRENIVGIYAQDTWHVNSRLTVNLGLRWEPMLFPTDYFGRGSVFDMGAFLAGTKSKVYPNAPAGSLFFGDQGVDKSFTDNHYTNFSPRIGFAWNPGGKSNQTIRAGAALLYDSVMVWFPQRLQSNPPVVNEIDLNASAVNGFSDPWVTGYKYPGGNPFPPTGAYFPTQAFFAVLPHDLKPTYMTTWNVSYQRQFAGNWMAQASYLGNKTTHVWLTQNINPAVYIPGSSTTANTPARRVLNLLKPSEGQFYGAVDLGDDGGNANYNALLLSLQHRLSHGFTVLANYTYSHCISNGDFNGDLRGSYYQNPANRSSDRGDCNFDYRQIFNVSMIGQSPFKGGWTGRLLGGWRIAPVIRAVSGPPITVTSGRDNSLVGENLDRANASGTGAPFYNDSIGSNLQWFNPAAFVTNPIGTFGTLGRSVFRGPGALNFDVGLTRTFPLTERIRLEARAEAFNVINHTNFAGPNANQSSGTFGRITATAGGQVGDPRILQFALKIRF
jgi:hypothetical protein